MISMLLLNIRRKQCLFLHVTCWNKWIHIPSRIIKLEFIAVKNFLHDIYILLARKTLSLFQKNRCLCLLFTRESHQASQDSKPHVYFLGWCINLSLIYNMCGKYISETIFHRTTTLLFRQCMTEQDLQHYIQQHLVDIESMDLQGLWTRNLWDTQIHCICRCAVINMSSHIFNFHFGNVNYTCWNDNFWVWYNLGLIITYINTWIINFTKLLSYIVVYCQRENHL